MILADSNKRCSLDPNVEEYIVGSRESRTADIRYAVHLYSNGTVESKKEALEMADVPVNSHSYKRFNEELSNH